MVNVLNVVVPFAAKPQGSKKAFVRNGHATLVEASKGLKPLRAQFSAIINATAYAEKWVRAEKDEPVKVSVIFTFKRPKTVKRLFMTTTPDGDKCLRFVLDSISDAKNVWLDDNQVTYATFIKQYGETDQTEITVETNG